MPAAETPCRICGTPTLNGAVCADCNTLYPDGVVVGVEALCRTCGNVHVVATVHVNDDVRRATQRR